MSICVCGSDFGHIRLRSCGVCAWWKSRRRTCTLASHKNQFKLSEIFLHLLRCFSEWGAVSFIPHFLWLLLLFVEKMQNTRVLFLVSVPTPTTTIVSSIFIQRNCIRMYCIENAIVPLSVPIYLFIEFSHSRTNRLKETATTPHDQNVRVCVPLMKENNGSNMYCRRQWKI